MNIYVCMDVFSRVLDYGNGDVRVSVFLLLFAIHKKYPVDLSSDGKQSVLIGLNFRRRHSALVEHCSHRDRPYRHANPSRCNHEQCDPVSNIGSRSFRHRLNEKLRREKREQRFYHDHHDNRRRRRHCFRHRRCSSVVLDNRDSNDLVGCSCNKRFDCCPTDNRVHNDRSDCNGN